MPGDVTATGVAVGSTNNLRGGASSIRGKGCLSHLLNAELWNLSNMYCLIMGRFSAVGAQGRTGSSVGGRDRLGHLQGMSCGSTTPVLPQLGRLGAETSV